MPVLKTASSAPSSSKAFLQQIRSGHRSVSFGSLLSLLIPLASLWQPAQACSPSLQGRQDGGGYNPFEFPSSCAPAKFATGYHLNHMSFVTANLSGMLDFYTKVMGMAHLFTYTPENATFFSITYLGHNDGVGSGTANGTIFSDCATFTAEKNKAKGLLEIVAMQRNVTSYVPLPATEVTNTFSHLGLIVPNTTEAQARFRELGVPILKEVGKLPPLEGPLANAYGLGRLSTLKLTREEKRAIIDGLVPSGTLQHVIVADPDGNVIEVQATVLEQ